MAYKYLSNVFCSDLKDLHNKTVALLTSAGWEVYDVVANKYTVMRSEGSEKAGRYTYLLVNKDSTQTNQFLVHMTSWNNTTHSSSTASVNLSSSSGTPSYFYGGSNMYWIYADENSFYCWRTNSNQSSYYQIGVFRPSYLPPESFYTTVSTNVNSGTNVVIPVANSSKFITNARYMIIDIASNRQTWFVTTAVGANSITVANLASSIKAGAYIGTCPYPISFCSAGGGNQYTLTGSIPNTTPVNLTATLGQSQVVMSYSADPVLLRKCYPVNGQDINAIQLLDAPIIERINNGNAFLNGYTNLVKITRKYDTAAFSGLPDFSYRTSTTNVGDVIYMIKRDEGISSGSNSLTTYNDSTKNWTTDQHAGKVLVMTNGPDSGTVIKIISNTSTQLVTSQMNAVPGNYNYIISDEAYRVAPSIDNASLTWLVREGV